MELCAIKICPTTSGAFSSLFQCDAILKPWQNDKSQIDELQLSKRENEISEPVMLNVWSKTHTVRLIDIFAMEKEKRKIERDKEREWERERAYETENCGCTLMS